MFSLCRLPVAKNHNFGQIVNFAGLLYRPPIPMKVTFGELKQTERLHLQAKFHLNVFIVSPSGGQKPQFWANFDFWGAPVPAPFTDKRQIWCPEADRTSTLTCQISSESVHCVGFQWRKTTILGKFCFLGAPVPTPCYR